MRGAEEPMASADWKDQSRTRLSALLAAMAALLWKQKRHSLISSTLGHLGVQSSEEELVISKPRRWLRGGRFAGTTT
jgi:hypothetical protein